jgi:hypothetical protein
LELRIAICAALTLVFLCYAASPRAHTSLAAAAARKHVAREAYVRRLPIPDSDVVVGTPRDGIVALPARREVR